MLTLAPQIYTQFQTQLYTQPYKIQKNVGVENRADLFCDPFPTENINQQMCMNAFTENNEVVDSNFYETIKHNNLNQVKAIVRKEVSLQLLFIYVLFFWQIIKLFDD
tara:strand:+ start:713 stop:1033 length:321 start_codon:yes stop_codon:yes gene_type:complete